MRTNPHPPINPGGGAGGGGDMDDGGAAPDGAEDGKNPAPSLRELRRRMKEKQAVEKGGKNAGEGSVARHGSDPVEPSLLVLAVGKGAGTKRNEAAGCASAGDAVHKRAREEADATPAAKKFKTGPAPEDLEMDGSLAGSDSDLISGDRGLDGGGCGLEEPAAENKRNSPPPPINPGGGAGGGGNMDDDGAPPDGAEDGKTPAPSMRELRRMMKEKQALKKGKKNVVEGRVAVMDKAAGTKRKEAGGCAGVGDTIDKRAREEAEATPAAKKFKNGPVPEDLKMDGSSAGSDSHLIGGVRGLDGAGCGLEDQKDPAAENMRNSISVVVAYTPSMPERFASLLRNITSLLCCENHGKAYECPPDRINAFLEWSECSFCLFFKWVEKDQQMFCQMFNMSRMCVTFLVNPAFPYEMFQVQVKSAALAFSSSFCCDNKWAAVKEVLMAIFRPQQEITEVPDHLYVFTRIDDYVYIRNMKMSSIPDVNSTEGAFVLQEMGPSFALKLLDIQDVDGSHIISDRVCDVSQNHSQMIPDGVLSPTVYYSTSPDELGSCIGHTFSLSDVNYMVLLESGMKLSKFEGFNVSLREYLVKESFLKIKKIIGSLTDEESPFVRNIAKFIIRSILAELIELFASGKCMVLTDANLLDHSNILLKGSSVKFFGVKIVKYEEEKARNNVLRIGELIEECFPEGLIPSDLEDVLGFLLEDPLANLEEAKDSSALLSARERRELLVYLHTEYMTNVKPRLLDVTEFFTGCPYLFTWMDTVKKNIYLEKSANLETKRVSLIVKEVEKVSVGSTDTGKIGAKGEFQFSFMRNSNVHIPEKALKDGFKSFRLTWSDYILTAYFRKYLAFIQKRMSPYLKPKRGKVDLNCSFPRQRSTMDAVVNKE